jgi:hypothetical protein
VRSDKTALDREENNRLIHTSDGLFKAKFALRLQSGSYLGRNEGTEFDKEEFSEASEKVRREKRQHGRAEHKLIRTDA